MNLSTVSAALGTVGKAVKAVAHRQSELEKKLAEATSNQNWGCPNSLLHEIARASYDFQDCQIIMAEVWSGSQERGAKWRRALKTLTLLEFLIKNGAERIVDEVRREQYKVRSLSDFSFSEDGKDKGAAVRDKAKTILELISDHELLRQERDKARQQRDKFIGMSNNESYGDSGGSRFQGFGGGGERPSSDKYDSYSGGSRYDPHIDNSKFEEMKKKRDEEREERERGSRYDRDGRDDRDDRRRRDDRDRDGRDRDGRDDRDDRRRRDDRDDRDRDGRDGRRRDDRDDRRRDDRDRDDDRRRGDRDRVGRGRDDSDSDDRPRRSTKESERKVEKAPPPPAPQVLNLLELGSEPVGAPAPAAPAATQGWGAFESDGFGEFTAASTGPTPVTQASSSAVGGLSGDLFGGEVEFQAAAPAPGFQQPRPMGDQRPLIPQGGMGGPLGMGGAMGGAMGGGMPGQMGGMGALGAMGPMGGMPGPMGGMQGAMGGMPGPMGGMQGAMVGMQGAMGGMQGAMMGGMGGMGSMGGMGGMGGGMAALGGQQPGMGMQQPMAGMGAMGGMGAVGGMGGMPAMGGMGGMGAMGAMGAMGGMGAMAGGMGGMGGMGMQPGGMQQMGGFQQSGMQAQMGLRPPQTPQQQPPSPTYFSGFQGSGGSPTPMPGGAGRGPAAPGGFGDLVSALVNTGGLGDFAAAPGSAPGRA